MESGLFIVIAVLVVVVVIVIAVMSAIAAKKRREGIAALAAQREWSYAERDDRWCDAFQDSPFGIGHNRKATNVLTGEFDGRPFVSFDYVYYTTETSTDSQGRTSTREVSHPYGVAGLDMGALFPALEVTPEGMFGRLIGRITNTDIQLESEDFNRAFTVNCPDRKFASDVLHPRMMELLMQSQNAAFRFDRRWILDCEDGRVELEQIEPRLQRIDAVIDQIPEFVWKEVRECRRREHRGLDSGQREVEDDELFELRGHGPVTVHRHLAGADAAAPTGPAGEPVADAAVAVSSTADLGRTARSRCHRTRWRRPRSCPARSW